MTKDLKLKILEKCKKFDDGLMIQELRTEHLLPIITELLSIIEAQEIKLDKMSIRTQSLSMFRSMRKTLNETTARLEKLAGKDE